MNTAFKSRMGRSAACGLMLLSACFAEERRSTTPVTAASSSTFDYEVEIEEGKPEWVPTQVFDDGRQTFIRFPPRLQGRELPALFVRGGEPPALFTVNYRVKGDLYVVDRLFNAATLRSGHQEQEVVNIFRVR